MSSTTKETTDAEEVQATLLGDTDNSTVRVETEGRVFRPFFALHDSLVNESRHHFDEDGLTVTAVDGAKVGMVDVTLNASAFDSYELDEDEVCVGVDHERLKKQVRDARLGESTSDPLSMRFDSTQTRVEITREYDRTTVTRRDEFLNHDVESVREPPNVPDHLDMAYEATVDVQAFADVINHIDTHADHAVFKERDGHFVITTTVGEDTEHATSADFGNIAEEADAPCDDAISKFSLGYLTSFASALKSAKIDEVSIEWGQELPVFLTFAREEDDEIMYSGQLMLAPRLHRDSRP